MGTWEKVEKESFPKVRAFTIYKTDKLIVSSSEKVALAKEYSCFVKVGVLEK